MTEKELQNYLITNFSIENEKCEWKEFKSLKNIQQASVSELAAIGLPSKVAQNVYEVLQQAATNPPQDGGPQ